MSKATPLAGARKTTADDISTDPLGEAFSILDRANTPVEQKVAKQIWRKLTVRNAVNEWIPKLANDPHFFLALQKGLPDDDFELLEEYKTTAESLTDTPMALFICVLADERLNRIRQQKGLQRGHWLVSGSGEESVADQLNAYAGLMAAQPRPKYNGFICAGVQTPDGKWLGGTEGLPSDKTTLAPNSTYRLIIWMDPNRPNGAWSDQVLIETGIEQETVSFGFDVDCPTLYFSYGRKRIRFAPRLKSDTVYFEFRTPAEPLDHLVLVHCFQENMLMKSLVVVLKVAP